MSGPYLGHVLWYTVRPPSEGRTLSVTPEDLERWFTELNLDNSYLPKAGKSIDAFRAATTGTSGPYTSEDGYRYELNVTETKTGRDLVLRQVIRRGLDVGSRKAERVAELKYFRARRVTVGRVRGTEDVKTAMHKGLTGIDLKVVQEFIDACSERYERQRRQLTPHTIRLLLRMYLTNLGGIPLPDASASYFVPPDKLETIRGLQTFVSRCSAGSRLRVMPLIDDDEQRDMLCQAIDADVDERATKALANISQWQDEHQDQKPGPRTTRAWYRGCRQLMDLLQTYGQQYDMTFPDAADSLENLRQAVHRLAGKVVASDRRR